MGSVGSMFSTGSHQLCRSKSADTTSLAAANGEMAKAGLEEKHSKKPRQLCTNKAPAPQGAQPPPRLSERHPQPVCPSVCPSVLAGHPRSSALSGPPGALAVVTGPCRILLLSVLMDCAVGLTCRIVSELGMAFG